MQLLTEDAPVGQWAMDYPQLIPVLERHQIDYCCGGDRTLANACHAAGVDLQEVLAEMSQIESDGDDASTVDWSTAGLADLCDHIEQTHHAFLREALPRLAQLATKARNAHADDHPKLVAVAETFRELFAELVPHMLKEEQILFPAIRCLEDAEQPIAFPFGSVHNPIHMMEHEHDQAGAALRKLRELTGGYHVPDDACPTYRALLVGLAQLEADLHEHIYKENNILFPRAAQLESTR